MKMTIEILKTNREEILRIIELKGESAKRIMPLMVSSIGCNVYDDMTVSQFTKAVITDNPQPLVISDNTEYYAAASLRQRSSSMR